MREAQFIKNNIERWESYKEVSSDPDIIAKRFTYLIDDLGYAKTNYSKSNIVKYLNSLAAEIYLSIYQNKKEKGNRLLQLFKYDIPLVIQKHYKLLIFSLILFVSIVLLGVLAAVIDPDFVRSILGDAYVNETMSNIKAGKPFDVYNDSNEYRMFIMITFNNIRVAFLSFTLGVFCGLGTFYIMFSNGIMVGAFYQMFAQQGLGVDWYFSVMLHGTFELFSIVVACMCGFIIGKSILFRGTYSFLQSIKSGAKDAMMVMIAVIPMLIIAGFIESYLTRYYAMPIIISGSILLICSIIIIWYFFIYPKKVAAKLEKGWRGIITL